MHCQDEVTVTDWVFNNAGTSSNGCYEAQAEKQLLLLLDSRKNVNKTMQSEIFTVFCIK